MSGWYSCKYICVKDNFGLSYSEYKYGFVVMRTSSQDDLVCWKTVYTGQTNSNSTRPNWTYWTLPTHCQQTLTQLLVFVGVYRHFLVQSGSSLPTHEHSLDAALTPVASVRYMVHAEKVIYLTQTIYSALKFKYALCGFLFLRQALWWYESVYYNGNDQFTPLVQNSNFAFLGVGGGGSYST